MRVFPRRLIALLVLVAFGPLAAGGQGWHYLTEHAVCRAESCDSDANDCQKAACADSAHGHCCGGHAAGKHHAKHELRRNSSHTAVSRPGHDHDLCLICQFFAQPQQSTPVDFVEVAEFVAARVDCVDAGAPRAAAALSYRSRAPPAAADRA